MNAKTKRDMALFPIDSQRTIRNAVIPPIEAIR